MAPTIKPVYNVAPPFDPKNPSITFNTKDPDTQSKTNQSDKDSTDINLIMAQYEKTGYLVDLITGQRRQPIYGDFSDVPDYHLLKSTTARVEQAFDLLPAKLRNQFANDPQELINFLADPKNDEEAITLGLKPQSEKKDPTFKADPQPADPAAKPGDPAKAGS